MFCSDLLHQFGAVAPITSGDLIEPAVHALRQMQQSPLHSYMPFTHQSKAMLDQLAQLQPLTLATMHGSSYSGNGEQLLKDFGAAMDALA